TPEYSMSGQTSLKAHQANPAPSNRSSSSSAALDLRPARAGVGPADYWNGTSLLSYEKGKKGAGAVFYPTVGETRPLLADILKALKALRVDLRKARRSFASVVTIAKALGVTGEAFAGCSDIVNEKPKRGTRRKGK